MILYHGDDIIDIDLTLTLNVLRLLDENLDAIILQAIDFEQMNFTKGETFQYGSTTKTGTSKIKIINAVAKYWKHRSEWALNGGSKWQEPIEELFDEVEYSTDTEYPVLGGLTELPRQWRCVLFGRLGKIPKRKKTMKTILTAATTAGTLIAIGALIAPTDAASLEISIEITSFNAVFNGITQSTGPLTLTINTDTNNPELSNGSNIFGGHWAASAMVTAPTLGLNNTAITNQVFLFSDLNYPFWGIAIDAPLVLGGPVWDFFNGPSLPMSNEFDLTNIATSFGPLVYTSSEFRTGISGIQFINGSQFNAGQNSGPSGGTASTSAVPEPSSSLLILVGLGALGLKRRRRIIN